MYVAAARPSNSTVPWLPPTAQFRGVSRGRLLQVAGAYSTPRQIDLVLMRPALRAGGRKVGK